MKFLVLLGFLIVVLVGVGYFFYGLQPVSEAKTVKEVTVERGQSFKAIGAKLSQTHLVKSISVFKLYTLISGNARDLKPGVYELSPSMSVPEIVNVLVQGKENDVSITIPEGYTLKGTDRTLASAEIIDKGDLENYPVDQINNEYSFLENITSLEGFIFPDTYRFNVATPVDKVVRKILDNFKDKAWPKIKDQENWYDRLILASYLEREVPEKEDRQIVAGLLLKRLNAGMPFQVDATLSYIKCGEKFSGCENIQVTKKDTKISSPYNTYQRIGWTPTPISNPGLEAIEAATNPQNSPYWYYLSSSETGETIFSRTLEEHNINRQNHL